jgi:hypothetical protein
LKKKNRQAVQEDELLGERTSFLRNLPLHSCYFLLYLIVDDIDIGEEAIALEKSLQLDDDDAAEPASPKKADLNSSKRSFL